MACTCDVAMRVEGKWLGGCEQVGVRRKGGLVVLS